MVGSVEYVLLVLLGAVDIDNMASCQYEKAPKFHPTSPTCPLLHLLSLLAGLQTQLAVRYLSLRQFAKSSQL